MNDLTLQIPVNNLSLGQVSINILKNLFRMNVNPCIFLIGNVDLSSFNLGEDFVKWLQFNVARAPFEHKRKNKTLKLWHINGSLESVAENGSLMTFHETSSLTPAEFNILSQQKNVFVTSNYTKQVFEGHGLKNVVYCPLGFDSDSFSRLDRDFHTKDFISFGLRGKFELRKHTLKTLFFWGRKFGNNENFRLDCSIFNPFYDSRVYMNQIVQIFNGNVPWNINFLPHQPLNSTYNETLNAVDVDLTGMSGCEGFNLPCFQSLCIGKQAVILNAHVHKDFANENNSVLVEPDNMIAAHDGIFFHKGSPFNQGNWFDFSEGAFHIALDKVVEKAKERNKEGEKLKDIFTYGKTTNTLLDNI